VLASLPSETPTFFESVIVLSSITQPFDQCGPIRPSCSAVGGAHCVAAFVRVKPRTVM
jgi:hypothetical protein